MEGTYHSVEGCISGSGHSKAPFLDLNKLPAEALNFNVSLSPAEKVTYSKQLPSPLSLPSNRAFLVAASPSSVSDGNGFKDTRESRDDNVTMIRDRKVKLSEGSSLYSLCRSWVKNGISEENKPQYTDCLKSLPKPMPAPVIDANSQLKQKDEKEEVEDVEDVDNLSSKELLQGHIKRAKKVRARLREERLQRIARYKGRLALLLPPVVEQQLKNDLASAN